MNPNKKRLRRTMMFLNAQKPGLIKDPYIYKPDSIMLDLEDAVAENQKDAARFSLFHALQEINYRGVEKVVRINALDTPYWKEDIRCSVAGGCDAIRIPKTESANDVKLVESAIEYAEREFGRPKGSVLIMAAIESARGVMRALDICESSERLFGIALSGGDYTKDLQTHITGTGIELMMASTILAAGVFLGVLEESEIMVHMANVLASFIPTALGRFLPLIIGVLSVPLTLLFCTDSYFFGLLPVLIGIGNEFGVEPSHIAIAMVVCRNCATFISPVVPATFLGTGLAGVEIKDHIKNSFFWIWGVSLVCLIAGIVLGILKF